MLYVGAGLVLVVAIVMGLWLKRVAPEVGILFWIILSLAVILVAIAALIRAQQSDFGL